MEQRGSLAVMRDVLIKPKREVFVSRMVLRWRRNNVASRDVPI
jgi:hypothetical protein